MQLQHQAKPLEGSSNADMTKHAEGKQSTDTSQLQRSHACKFCSAFVSATLRLSKLH
jgi:hypothetical protein